MSHFMAEHTTEVNVKVLEIWNEADQGVVFWLHFDLGRLLLN